MVKDCSQGAMGTAIYLSELMDCLGFSIIVETATCEEWIIHNPFILINKSLHNHIVWTTPIAYQFITRRSCSIYISVVTVYIAVNNMNIPDLELAIWWVQCIKQHLSCLIYIDILRSLDYYVINQTMCHVLIGLAQ